MDRLGWMNGQMDGGTDKQQRNNPFVLACLTLKWLNIKMAKKKKNVFCANILSAMINKSLFLLNDVDNNYAMLQLICLYIISIMVDKENSQGSRKIYKKYEVVRRTAM